MRELRRWDGGNSGLRLSVRGRTASGATCTGVTGDGGTGGSTETSGGGRFLDFVLFARGVTSKDAFVADSGSGGMSKDVLYAGAEGGGK